MITRKQRQELAKIFKEKAEIQAKVDYNLLKLKDLKKMILLEENYADYDLINSSIRRGERYVSIQKTDLMKLSIQNISKSMGVTPRVVQHQASLFNARVAEL